MAALVALRAVCWVVVPLSGACRSLFGVVWGGLCALKCREYLVLTAPTAKVR